MINRRLALSSLPVVSQEIVVTTSDVPAANLPLEKRIPIIKIPTGAYSTEAFLGIEEIIDDAIDFLQARKVRFILPRGGDLDLFHKLWVHVQKMTLSCPTNIFHTQSREGLDVAAFFTCPDGRFRNAVESHIAEICHGELVGVDLSIPGASATCHEGNRAKFFAEAFGHIMATKPKEVHWFHHEDCRRRSVSPIVAVQNCLRQVGLKNHDDLKISLINSEGLRTPLSLEMAA